MQEEQRLDILAALRSLFSADAIEEDAPWLRVWTERLDASIRSGWKLHLSSVPAQLPALLERALPVLRSLGIPFKVLAAQEDLEEMNDGRYGLMQVGKAATVYPVDEASARAAAEMLRGALRGLSGPRIPSDYPYCSEAPVYFRYGPYDGRFVIDAAGRKQRILWHPEFGDVVDLTSGGDTPPPRPALLPHAEPYDHLSFLRQRFLFVRMLQLTAKGAAFVAVDRVGDEKALLLVKTAKAGTNSDRFGRDAVWALKRERSFLEDLADVPGVPPPGELLENGGEAAALARPYIEGETFWEVWTAPNARTKTGRRRLQHTLRSAAGLVAAAHARGIVIRDVSPGNILVSADAAYLLDLELGHRMGSDEPAYRRGTPGFYDPKSDQFRVPCPREDHYGLLALALMAHTGIHPAWFSGGLREWSEKSGECAGTAFQRAWRATYESDAFMEDYGRLLEHVTEDHVPSHASLWPPDELLPRFKDHLRQRLDVCAAQHRGSEELTVYDGLAGLLLVSLEWDPDAVLGDVSPRSWRTLADRLAAAAQEVSHIPGLYFGTAGIGLALVALGRWLENRALLDSGRGILLDGIDADGGVPDICQGLAGFLLGLLGAGAITGDGLFVDRAVEVGRRLVAMAEPAGADGVVWSWPEGPYGSLSGARVYGFAHGVAGAAYALFRLHERTAGDTFLGAAEAGLATLRTASRAVEGAEDALWWPCSQQDSGAWNAWCHGTPGVVKAFTAGLRVRAHDGDRRLLIEGVRGIMAANNGDHCLCHGVASRLDAYQDALELSREEGSRECAAVQDSEDCREQAPNALGDQAFRRALVCEAGADAALLSALDLFALERMPRTADAGREPRGLMTGAAGVVRTLLRHRGRLHGPYGQLLP